MTQTIADAHDVVQAALRALGDIVSEAVVVTGNAGRVVSVNRAAGALFGWRMDSLAGRSCRNLLSCRDEDGFGRPKASCVGGRFRRGDEQVARSCRADGGLRVAGTGRSTLLLSDDGTVLGALCTFTANRQNAVLDRAAAEFLSNVSHELRTPLSSLAGSIELLSTSYRNMPQQDMGNVLRVIHHSTLQLRNLVENLLNASSIQIGSFHVQPSPRNALDVIEEAVSFVQPILDRKGQALRKDVADAPFVMMDARRIVQVLINLLSNASKYAPAGDSITLRVATHGRSAVFSVSENGPGIACEERDGIFERFYRSRSGAEGTQGVGLGLALVKSIVSAHGGEVGVESQPGAGSTFWFKLPLVEGRRRRLKLAPGESSP